MKSSNSFIPSMIIIIAAIALVSLFLVSKSDENEAKLENNGPVKLKTQAAFSPFGGSKAHHYQSLRPVKASETAASATTNLPEKTSIEVSDESNELDEEAMATFALSVEVDDPRAPPISRREPHQTPSEDVLEDPTKYSEFESQQRRDSLQKFVTAASKKVAKLEELIAMGKARGISQEKLQEGLDKLAALKAGIKTVQQEL